MLRGDIVWTHSGQREMHCLGHASACTLMAFAGFFKFFLTRVVGYNGGLAQPLNGCPSLALPGYPCGTPFGAHQTDRGHSGPPPAGPPSDGLNRSAAQAITFFGPPLGVPPKKKGHSFSRPCIIYGSTSPISPT